MVHAVIRGALTVTSQVTTTVMLQPTVNDEKLGSIKLCAALAVCLGIAWTVYYLKRDLFKDQSIVYMVLIGASFCATSLSMNVLNKICVSLTGAPSTLTTIQMAVTLTATMALNFREVLGADRKKMLKWMIVPVVYAGMLNSSLLGYEYLTLSLVTVFRNLAPLVTMTIESVIMEPDQRPKVTLPIICALLMMVCGAFIFAHGSDHSTATVIGLAVMALNTMMAIGDRLLQRRLLVSECKDLPLSACMTLNNSLGMIPTFAMAMTMHEVQGYQAHHAAWTDPPTLLLIAMSGGLGMGIGFFALMCQKAMSATSFMVLQNMSKIAVVGVGVFVFGDQMSGPARICGMILSLLGSAAYGFAVKAAAASQEMASKEPLPKDERHPLLGGRFAPLLALLKLRRYT